MNKKLILGAVAILVVVGGAWYYKGQSGGEGSGSLRSLMAAGRAQKCTYSVSAGGATSSGTVYIVKDRMRGDFTTTQGGTTTGGHMIVVGDTTSFWTDGETQGFTMKTTAENDGAGVPAAQQAVDLDADTAYRCSGWSVDEGQFKLPTGIKFSDFSTMMQDVQKAIPGAGNGAQSACGACDTLSGDERTQCRAALQCN
ncbi:MAG: hypothetical protein IT405_01565 [Candidatus Yanofskybacteria bacterium]|nr:hypothetical protein [Candidatus Yanofskybacteria bacterium]